jgi:hypothetical protein
MDAADIRQEIGDIERKLVGLREAACRQQDRAEAGEKVDQEALDYIKGEIDRLTERQEELIDHLQGMSLGGSLELSPSLKSNAINDYGVYIFFLGVLFLFASIFAMNKYKSSRRSSQGEVTQEQLLALVRIHSERQAARQAARQP